MATNELLPFASTDTTTNLLTQAEYVADAQRPLGNQPGLARSKLINKVLRQVSLLAAAIGKFTADRQATNVTDGLAVNDLAGAFVAALRAENATTFSESGKQQLTNTGYQKFPGGLIVQWGFFIGVTGYFEQVNYPVPFTTAVFQVLANEGNAEGWGVPGAGGEPVPTIHGITIPATGSLTSFRHSSVRLDNLGNSTYQAVTCRWIAVGV
jgi:hypothetical protein